MANNISTAIESQIPEYIRENSTFFSDFIKTYYKYAEKRVGSIGLTQNRIFDTDIDLTKEDYLVEFYATYGEKLPFAIAYDKRNFIKLLNTIYNAKGTEKSLKLVFKLLFNEDIKVSYPAEQILKASDGNWIEEKFITLFTQSGTVPLSNVQLVFKNSFGAFSVDSTRIEYLTQDTTRFYFKSFSKIGFVDNQLVYVKNNSNIVFSGKLLQSPSKLIIKQKGRDWQIGQVIIVPGTIKNTIGRVVSIDNNGGINSIEILEYGYSHNINQELVISPYPHKPANTQYDISSVLTSVNPPVRHITLTINDSNTGTVENLEGHSSVINDKSYFLENYSNTYTDQIVISAS